MWHTYEVSGFVLWVALFLASISVMTGVLGMQSLGLSLCVFVDLG